MKTSEIKVGDKVRYTKDSAAVYEVVRVRPTRGGYCRILITSDAETKEVWVDPEELDPYTAWEAK